jgi:hypothetical protein
MASTDEDSGFDVLLGLCLPVLQDSLHPSVSWSATMICGAGISFLTVHKGTETREQRIAEDVLTSFAASYEREKECGYGEGENAQVNM